MTGKRVICRPRSLLAVAAVMSTLAIASGAAQQAPGSEPGADTAQSPFVASGPATKSALGEGPWVFATGEHPMRVVRIATVDHPWSIAFLPDGAMLVTERPGRLRIIRNGVLDPQPIPGVPTVLDRGRDGLLDIELHPRFTENRLVYLTYSKPGEDGSVRTALARGRFDGTTLADVRDIFVANTPIPRTQTQSVTSRIVFGRDGMLYMTVGAPRQSRLKAQDPSSHRGKVLRLRDDGTAPPDNPFVGKSAYGLPYQPEIYSVGHRNGFGLAFHPETGALWESENGPQSGDEINIILPGRNYGWPFISMGWEYDGTPFPLTMEGMEQPFLHWSPNIAVAGMTFYTGDRFPRWKGDVFIGGLVGTRVERLQFNSKGLPVKVRGGLGREFLLHELQQRIRDVKEGPDGLLYVLTDEQDGAVLRLEPVD